MSLRKEKDGLDLTLKTVLKKHKVGEMCPINAY